ncbi:MAG: hypothetical protein ACFFBD_23645 [Candidatus Hodarchaeota archaeon]
MVYRRSKLPSGMELDSLQEIITKAQDFIKENNIPLIDISSEELIEYFAGETPSGDVTTLADVLDNQWLLIHELIELSELKRVGLSISFSLLFTHLTDVYEAHVTATEWEFYLAKQMGDEDWIVIRLPLVTSWLNHDPDFPTHLRERLHNLLASYA